MKRRSFLGYFVGGVAGGIFSADAASLFARTKKIFSPEKKIVVKQNPLAVPREMDEVQYDADR